MNTTKHTGQAAINYLTSLPRTAITWTATHQPTPQQGHMADMLWLLLVHRHNPQWVMVAFTPDEFGEIDTAYPILLTVNAINWAETAEDVDQGLTAEKRPRTGYTFTIHP
ncbi:hypothetical protein ACFWPK_28310 [Nocardia sp. NPDC058519]|uniref:hypothetical protein n=1 Tax=Nocardia sp. NPDC058519 TaxID=3346535 RepID=UPI0036503B46